MNISGVPFAGCATGVGHNKKPLSRMRRTDGTSWKYKRPRGVARSLQVIKDFIESEGNVAFNVFSNNPSRRELSHKSEHFRPQVALVSVSAALAGMAEWLAWVASDHKLNWWQFVSCNCSYIVVNPHIRPPCRQHRLAKLVALAEGHGLKSCPFGGNVQPANPGKQTKCVHGKSV
jgi:hypothetical protein